MQSKPGTSRIVLRRKERSAVPRDHEGNRKLVVQIAGCLSDNDANELKTIIDNGCERIEPDAWKNLR